MPVWVLGLLAVLLLGACAVGGVRLYWPHRVDPLSRRDLGLALLSGALLTLIVLLLQGLIDQQLQDREVRRDSARAAEAVRAARLDNQLSRTDLTEVDLQDQNLDGFVLDSKNLTKANLSRATLSGARLRRTTLLGAILKDASLTKAVLDSADLREATLERVSAAGASFDSADLEGARLAHADLRGANFRLAKARADFRGADLSNADMYNADLSGANLRDADLRNADLKYASLRGAHLEGADLRRASLEGVDFSHARYDARTTWPKEYFYELCKKKVCRFPETPSSGARAPFPKRLQEIKRVLARNLPNGWTVLRDPFGVTVRSAGEKAALYGESVPLRSGITAKEYAELYDEDFKQNYPGFRQYEFRPIELLGGRRGFARRYGYRESGSYHIAIDTYHVEGGHGFVFVFTSDAVGWPFFKRPFRQIMRVLQVKPDLFAQSGN